MTIPITNLNNLLTKHKTSKTKHIPSYIQQSACNRTHHQTKPIKMDLHTNPRNLLNTNLSASIIGLQTRTVNVLRMNTPPQYSPQRTYKTIKQSRKSASTCFLVVSFQRHKVHFHYR